MDYQGQILEFLRQPENLPVALEVAEHVKKMSTHLHKAFWKDMHQALEDRLVKLGFSDRWFILSDKDFNEPYKSLQIRTKANSSSDSVLRFGLMQAAPEAKYRLHYGLCWGLSPQPAPDTEAFRALLAKSREAGVLDDKDDKWWPMKSYLNIFPQSDEFTLQYGLNSARFIEELAESVWTYFTIIEPELYQLNQEL